MAGGHTADAAAAVDERELTSAEAYDDGFTPRSCPTTGRLLRQPASPTLPAGMTVMQGAVDLALALEAYEFTAALGQPWGTYLTSHGESAPGELALQRIGAEPEVESLAARLQRELNGLDRRRAGVERFAPTSSAEPTPRPRRARAAGTAPAGRARRGARSSPPSSCAGGASAAPGVAAAAWAWPRPPSAGAAGAAAAR